MRRRLVGTGLALSVAVALLGGGAQGARAAATRSYTAGRFALSLGGVLCGFVRLGKGTQAASFNMGTHNVMRKHVEGIKIPDISLITDFSLNRALYRWISDSWQGRYERKDGAIIAYDYNLKAVTERAFFHALLGETVIPACDGSSKDPAYMTVVLDPEYTKEKALQGGIPAPHLPLPQKTWLPSNFRLEIQGLDCRRVSKIDSFTVKQSIRARSAGPERGVVLQPGKALFPKIGVTLADSSSTSWLQWQKLVAARKPALKNGSLIFLAQDLRTELARIDFFGLRLVSLTHLPLAGGPRRVRYFKAELQCQRMTFHCP